MRKYKILSYLFLTSCLRTNNIENPREKYNCVGINILEKNQEITTREIKKVSLDYIIRCTNKNPLTISTEELDCLEIIYEKNTRTLIAYCPTKVCEEQGLTSKK